MDFILFKFRLNLYYLFFKKFKFKFRVSIDRYFGYRMQHKDSNQTNQLTFQNWTVSLNGFDTYF